MEYQKIINLLGNTPNQQSKFRIKYWVEINDGGSRTYNPNSQIKFKTSMLKSSLCHYIVSYVLGRIISHAPVPPPGLNPNNSNKELIFKNCAPFTDCISEISNTQIDNAKDNDVVMPVCNLIEYSDNYLKKSGGLDEPFLEDYDVIADFPPANNSSASFKFK